MDEGLTLRLRQVRMIKQTLQKKSKTPSPIGGVATASTSIPDKLYFRIGDVARLCGVEAYVLRFWETEFPQLKPNKSGTGQRLYRRREVELALRIKQLLYADGYTIAGARQVFTAESRESKKVAQTELPLRRGRDSAEKQLLKLRGELREILGILSSPVKPAKHGDTGHTGPRNHDRSHDQRHDQAGPGLFDA